MQWIYICNVFNKVDEYIPIHDVDKRHITYITIVAIFEKVITISKVSEVSLVCFKYKVFHKAYL